MARAKKILGTKTSGVKFIGEVNKSNVRKISSDTKFITAFKALLREFSVPTLEYAFTSNSNPGTDNCLDTGTEGVHADFFGNLSATASADSTGEFDGHSKITNAAHYIREGYADAKIDKRQDRTYIWVMDVESNLSSCYLNFGGTGASENAWGWLYVGTQSTTHHQADAGVFASRYLWDSPAPISNKGIKLTAATGSHSQGGTPVDFVTTALGGMPTQPRRSVFCVSYDLSETEATIRWRQTGNAAGHTFITSGSAADGGGIVYTYLAGYTGNGPVGAKFKYIAVIDAVLTADQFDELAEIALGG